jgi:HSP20 family molecular chaperone IbpA
MSEKFKLRMSPTTTTYHDDKKYEFEFELPGIKKNNVKVTTTTTAYA